MKIISGQLKLNHGLTRLDVLGVVGGLLALTAVAYACIWVGGEKRRVWVCANHLKTLGQAFNYYAHDHGDALPPAVLVERTGSTSWDKEIAPYLEPKLTKQSSPEEQKKQMEKVAHIFKCPSDREPRGGALARSYSMPMYDLNRVSWPPDEQCLGGLGLYLDAKVIQKIHETDSAEAKIPALKISMVKAPADTALLVERISIVNALWATKFACTISAKEQFDAKTFEAKDFHGGKMNYLLLDGHVELMSISQSIGLMGGVWTIRPKD